MHPTSVAIDVRTFWTEQLPLCKLYACYLAFAAIHTLLSLSRMLSRVHSHRKEAANADYESKRRLLVALQNKSDNLFRLTYFSTLLFGVVFFLQFPANFRSLVDTNLTGWSFIGYSLAIYFEFAACVLLVLLILHAAEWIASAHLRRITLPH